MTQLSRSTLFWLAGIVAVMIVGLVVLRLDTWIVVLVAVALAALMVGTRVVALRRNVESVRQIAAAHRDALTMSTMVLAWQTPDRTAARRVVALVADRAGISLRDAADAEVALLESDGILAIDLAPLGRTAFRPFRIQTVGHGTLDLAMSQLRPDDQVDAVVALRSAVGRTS